MEKEKRCINCKYFGESGSNKIYCGVYGMYADIINNPKMESCNLYEDKEVKRNSPQH